MRRHAWVMAGVITWGCATTPPLFPDRSDHQLWAGAASVVITPAITDPWTSCNITNTTLSDDDRVMFHGTFDPVRGAFSVPMENPGCTKFCGANVFCDNFTDTNRNGIFDGVWMAGFQNNRPAQGVHDDLTTRCLALSYDSDYVVFCSVDFIGFLANRTRNVKERMAPLGVDGTRVIIASTHNHEGPDTIGIWGPDETHTGLIPGFLDSVVVKVAEAARTAAHDMVPVRTKLGQRTVSDYCPYCSGPSGRSWRYPHNYTGLVDDLRDPMVIDDLVTAMRLEDLSGTTVATVVNWSNHDESMSDGNSLLSTDYAGYVRRRMEMEYGGISLFFPSGVGGISTPLGVPVPLRNEDGTTVTQTSSVPPSVVGQIITDGVLGTIVTVISTPDASWEKTRSLGYVVAETAISALESQDYDVGHYTDVKGLTVRSSAVYLPIVNTFFNVALSTGLFEVTPDYLVSSPSLCPDIDTPKLSYRPPYGCIEDRVFVVGLGDAQIITVPGEIFMELVRGLPDDFASYVSLGTRPNKFFPQHDPSDPMSQHADPYIIERPIRPAMRAPFKFVLGLANDEVGYIVPENDFIYNPTNQGDHYEETNSLGPRTAPLVLEKVHELLNQP